MPTRPKTDIAASLEDRPAPFEGVRKRHRVQPPPSAEPADEPEAERVADYVVGYRRPPNHTKFKPGASGNPKGRPKGAKSLKTLVRTMMNEKVSVRTTAGISKMTRIEALLHKMLELALKGNLRAQSQLFNLYASAVTETTLDGPGDGQEADEQVQVLHELCRKFLQEGS